MPPGVSTVTCTVPLPGGAIASISVPETTVKLVARTLPNFTAAEPSPRLKALEVGADAVIV